MSMVTDPTELEPADLQPRLEAATDLSNRTLGDFRLLRKLGQGGMGQVYLAEQISLKRKVALKVLRPDMNFSPQALARFKTEAENVARITHANIVQVYSYGEADGMPYIALEYVEGRNLREYLSKKGCPDLPIALSLMRQVASALQRASELGIIHRDIKPENILLTRKGEVKVADFGLSRCLQDDGPALNLTQSGVAMGTPLYMSPEQIEGKPVDSRTDIYSFGVTCYQLFSGHPPFQGSSPFQVALAHVHKQAVPLQEIRPDLPESLCQLIHRMMAKNPDDRPQTGRELLRELARIREGISGSTQVVPPLPVPTGEAQADPPIEAMQTANSASWAAELNRRFSPRWQLFVLFVVSLLLALASGAALAWRDQQAAGPLPGGQIPPTDASAVEAILLPAQREHALRVLVDQTLQLPPDKVPDPGGLSNCLDLGLFYLDEYRLHDAEQLFSRLSQIKQPSSYHLTGQVGQAIVLAMQNKPMESNKLLVEVFAPLLPSWGRFLGPPVKQKKGMVRPNEANLRKLEASFGPIKLLLDHPRARDWLARARWYNYHNGLPEDRVPTWLIRRFPLANDKK